jgi:type IV pilus assembly protein PilB
LEAGFSRTEVDAINLFKGKGCPHCFNTGYRGRVGVFEVMEMTNQLAQAIVSGVPEFQLRKIALQDGMLTLRQDALIKVKQELTTLDETLNETVLQQDAMPAFMVESDVLVFEHGQDIFKAGEIDSNFYKLVDGRLAVIKNNEKIDEITENNTYFGELNGLVKGKRKVTIRSQGRSIVKIYSGENLFDTLDYHPEMYRQITTKLIGMLHENKKTIQKTD